MSSGSEARQGASLADYVASRLRDDDVDTGIAPHDESMRFQYLPHDVERVAGFGLECHVEVVGDNVRTVGDIEPLGAKLLQHARHLATCVGHTGIVAGSESHRQQQHRCQDAAQPLPPSH